MAVRKALGVLVSLLALAGVLVTGVLVSRRIDQRPRTDDAYLQADLVHMAPDVSGRIVELDVRDNQQVRKGEVLFRIDPEPYRMQRGPGSRGGGGPGSDARPHRRPGRVADLQGRCRRKRHRHRRSAAGSRDQHAGADAAAARAAALSPRSRSTRRARRSAPRRSHCSRRGCRPPRRARPSPAPSPPRRSWKARARHSRSRSAT